MGDEREFKIKITADASSAVAGAKQTSEALQGTKIKLSELTPEQKSYTEAVEAGGKASQDTEKNLEGHTEKLQFLGVKTGELRKLTRDLSSEFPIAGMAARLMINPIVAGLTLAIMTFGAAKKALDDWDARLEASAQRNASKDFLPGIEAKKVALDQAAASTAEFATALGNIGAAEDKFKTSVSQAIDKLHEFTNAQAEVNSAGEAKELAEVDLKQKSGKLDEVGAIKQRGAIRERYRKMQDDLKTKGEQDEIKLQETELEHDKQTQPTLSQAAADARKRRDELKARRAQAEKDLEKGKEKAGEYDKDVEDAAKEVTEVEAAQQERGIQFGMGSHGVGNALTQANETLAQAQASRAAQGRFNQTNRALIKSLDEGKLPEAEGMASVADTRAKSNAERINELERTLPAKKDVLGIREQGRAVAGGLKDQTTEIETGTQIAGEVQRLEKEVAELKAQIVQSAASGRGVNPAALDVLKALEESDEKMIKELRSQEQRIRRMEAKPPPV